MNTVRLGEHEIGSGNPPFFIAELGICHGGSIEEALFLAHAAAEAGAHCIKTETFQRTQVVLDPSAVAVYSLEGKRHQVSLADHMDRYELSLEEHAQVKDFCDQCNLPFMTTVHDNETVDFMINLGAAALKIASPDIVHYPLLRHVAATGLPVFIDTGASMQHEIEIAIKTLRDAGCDSIVVNHNPAGHPAPPEGHDLRTIVRLKEILGLPVGLADHYEGYEMVYAAIAAGADMIEKPISRDRFVPEPERNYSISLQDLPQVLTTMRNIHKALGKPERTMTPEQEAYRNNNRSACAAKYDLNAGDILSLDNVIFGRPRKGIGVEHWDLIAGRVLRTPLKRHEFIRWENLG